MGDLTALEQRAVDYAKRGDFGPDALRVNEEITRIAPASPAAWTRLARCCLELRQLDEASAALDRALALNPQNTIARNLQGEVARHRAGPVTAVPPRRPRQPRATIQRASAPARNAARGFGRAEFAALGHLPPDAAVEALGGGIEALLVALNDKPFAQKVVEARNRAGHAGNWLFRRNTVRTGGQGHLYAFHHGGEREPQINVGFHAAAQWQQSAVRAGLGFHLAPAGVGPAREADQERVLASFERFQRLVSARWRQMLTAWMGANGGFIQVGRQPAETGLMPDAAVTRLLDIRHPAEAGWVFCGRWLFLDRADDTETLADGSRLVRWMERTFTDLLPLWMDVYRG